MFTLASCQTRKDYWQIELDKLGNSVSIDAMAIHNSKHV